MHFARNYLFCPCWTHKEKRIKRDLSEQPRRGRIEKGNRPPKLKSLPHPTAVHTAALYVLNDACTLSNTYPRATLVESV